MERAEKLPATYGVSQMHSYLIGAQIIADPRGKGLTSIWGLVPAANGILVSGNEMAYQIAGMFFTHSYGVRLVFNNSVPQHSKTMAGHVCTVGQPWRRSRFFASKSEREYMDRG
jgi:hypothetical protein